MVYGKTNDNKSRMKMNCLNFCGNSPQLLIRQLVHPSIGHAKTTFISKFEILSSIIQSTLVTTDTLETRS